MNTVTFNNFFKAPLVEDIKKSFKVVFSKFGFWDERLEEEYYEILLWRIKELNSLIGYKLDDPSLIVQETRELNLNYLLVHVAFPEAIYFFTRNKLILTRDYYTSRDKLSINKRTKVDTISPSVYSSLKKGIVFNLPDNFSISLVSNFLPQAIDFEDTIKVMKKDEAVVFIKLSDALDKKVSSIYTGYNKLDTVRINLSKEGKKSAELNI